MSKFFYHKLAITNIKKNSKNYFPYIITCIAMVSMYYMISSLSQNSGLDKIIGSDTLTSILKFATVVTGIFAAIFLFYTNSFLMKQRKKEFGLYSILGMEKRHISRVLLCEALIISSASIFIGLLLGMLLDKAMFLALLKMFSFEIVFGYEISTYTLLSTLCLFVGIFLLILLRSIALVHLSKPIELLKGGQVGEREPKTKWLLTIIGLLCLFSGYFISVTITNPIMALSAFLVAVILVIIGTYLLFSAGSIALLKLLRKNKKYYYKTKNFISISGMIYRMNQNSVGLANICILSTAVLVMISSTLSLYLGSENILQTRYPRNIMFSSWEYSAEAIQKMDGWIDDTLEKNSLAQENELKYVYLNFGAALDGDFFDTSGAEGILSTIKDVRELTLVPLEDYNRWANEKKTLEDGEILIFSNREKYTLPKVRAFDMEFTVKEVLTDFMGHGRFSADIFSSLFIVVKDLDVLELLHEKQAVAYGNNSSHIRVYYGFDLDADSETVLSVHQQLIDKMVGNHFEGTIECRDDAKGDFLSLYGGLFFIGVFLGVLFIMATILIIYYKQISEGYDDKDRFDIMQKVGMSKGEIKKCISSQVLTVFYLPLLTAGIHIAFAFPLITRLLSLLNLSNVGLFALCTIACFSVFAVLYTVVYIITARVYYKIVS